MLWNPASVMPVLIFWYSGNCLYFSNSAIQAASDSGGSQPVIGFHSTIERPDSVRRVNPPITTQAGQRYYDIPDDLHLERIERIDYFWGDKWYPLERGINVEDYNIHDSDADVREEPAIKWDVSDTGSEAQIEIWPIPVTDGREIRVTGIRKLTPLIVAGDRLDLDDMMISLFTAAELLADRNKQQAGVLQQKAVSRFNTVKGRVIQTKKNSFSFARPDPQMIRRDRTPQVAYVRDAD